MYFHMAIDTSRAQRNVIQLETWILHRSIDIDGNDRVDALTDGLLTIRCEFGFTDNTLIDGTVGEGYLRSLEPQAPRRAQGGAPHSGYPDFSNTS
jgi:hypothetical protein